MVDVAIETIAKQVEPSGEASEPPADVLEKRRILPALRDITLVATIYLFFTGFVFRYFYFHMLGVSPNEIDVSVNALLVLAFNVFENQWWLPIALIAAFAVITVPRVRAVLDVAFVPILAAAVIGSFFVLYSGARATAKLAVSIVRQGVGLPPVFVKLRNDGRYDSDFRAATGATRCAKVAAYLVEQNASTYFILVEHNPSDAGRPDRLYAVPKSDVFYVAASLEPCRR